MSVPFTVKALHDYKSDYDDDLQFAAGQVITVTDIEDDEWYSGTYGGQSGLFPKNFVETLVSQEPAAPEPPLAAAPRGPVSGPAEANSAEVSRETPAGASAEAPESSETSVPLQAESAESFDAPNESETDSDQESDDPVGQSTPTLPKPLDETKSVLEADSGHAEPASLRPPIPGPQDASPAPMPVSGKMPDAPPPVPRVPIPGSLPLKRDDPYAINKQFIGAGKSSYVPQVTPRDNSTIPHGFNDVSANRQIAKETDDAPQAESNEPKMSLKERIAMLQKRQQEEAEREAAALKKKEERKRKVEEEKKLRASQVATQPDSAVSETPAEQTNDSQPLGEQSQELGLAASPRSIPLQMSGASSVVASGTQQESLASNLHLEEAQESEEDSTDPEEDAQQNPDTEVETKESTEEIGEDEEEDEDLRRRRLVERMAKISGGRNMFGMMGMPSPFGNTPAPAVKSTKETPKLHPPEDAQNLSSPVDNALEDDVPIPVVSPQESEITSEPVPGVNGEPEVHDQVNVAPVDNVGDEEDDVSEENSDTDFQEAVVSPEDAIARGREEKSTPENLIQTQDSMLSPPLRSSSQKSFEPQFRNMNIMEEAVQESLIAGYEADADILDRGVISGKEPQVLSDPTDVASDTSPRPHIPLRSDTAPTSIPPVPLRSDTAPTSIPPVPLRSDTAPTSIPPVPLKSDTAPTSIPPVPLKSDTAPTSIPPVPLRSDTAPTSIPPVPLKSDTAPTSIPPIPLRSAAPTSIPPIPPTDTERDAHPPLPSEDAPSSPAFRDLLTGSSSLESPLVSKETFPSDKALHGSFQELPSIASRNPPPPPPPPQSRGLTDEQLPTHEKRPPPPIPNELPAPPSLQGPNTIDGEEDTSDEDIQLMHTQPNLQSSESGITPINAARKATSGSLKRNSTESSRRFSDLRRSGSLKDGRSIEQEQSSLQLNILESELSVLSESSGWWIKSEIPDSLSGKLGIDLEFEVDENRIRKRDGREVIYKDYYILFHDLSQLIFEIQYQSDDPRETVSVGSVRVKGSPKIRKDILHSYSSNLGHSLAEYADKAVGSKLGTSIVEEAFLHLSAKNPNLLRPIGEKAFGSAIYKNFNHNVTRIDEIRPGDIVCMRSAKFTSHKGLGGLGVKNISAGEGNEIYSAIVLQYDPKKDKIKVAESGKGGVVKKESYKFGEMKSGKIRIYRVVSRDSVGWC